MKRRDEIRGEAGHFMHHRFSFVVFCFVLLACASTVSCASKPEDVLLGTWQTANGVNTLEFLKNGTLIFTERQRSMPLKYKVIDSKRISVEGGMFGQS